MSAALGRPLLPWQQYVADVSGEKRPDSRYRYPIVVLTVPRQSGKTVLLGARGVHRCARQNRARVFYTAQTGKDARARWEDIADAVTASPLGPHVTTRLRAGAEAMHFPNKSAFGVFSPKRDALHGETPQLVMLDEAWKHDPALGEDLMGAIRPAQITVKDRQLWIVSTAGDTESAWFRSWVDAGRAATTDPDADIAYFEWSAPDDAPRDDPDTWATYHPTYGQLINADDLRENLTLTDFDRAYLNRWPIDATAAVIPSAAWSARVADVGLPDVGHLITFGFEVGPDRADAAIVASWHDPITRARRVALVEYAGGSTWLPARLHELIDRWRPKSITADDRGPAAPVIDQMRLDGYDVDTLMTRDYATACGALVGHVIDGTLTHDGAPMLADSVASGRRRMVGDLWVWDRRHTGDGAPTATALIAATVATWQHDHAPDPIPDPPYVIVTA